MSVRVNCIESSVERDGWVVVEFTPDANDGKGFCIQCGRISDGSCPCEAYPCVPKDLDNTIIHSSSCPKYKLYGLPVPRLGQVVGLVGSAHTAGSTALRILGRKIKPNIGRIDNPPAWSEILAYFEGSDLYNYFTHIVVDKAEVRIKPYDVLAIQRAIGGTVGELLDKKDDRGIKVEICLDLQLNQIIDRNLAHLSPGELQRFAIGAIAVQSAEVYMFEEPSNYLDVKQRFKAAQVIRSLSKLNSYVMVSDHDLSVLGYLSDFIFCLYRLPGAIEVVTLPFSVREGISIFLDGCLQTRNLRFREESLTFEVAKTSKGIAEEVEPFAHYKYPSMSITRGSFKLKVKEGEFTGGQITVILGENGTGKTTFIRMLAGFLKSDTVGGSTVETPEFCVSYKGQKVKAQFPYSVRECLNHKIYDACQDPEFISSVVEPLRINELMDRRVMDLAGGEMNRLALCVCLGKAADIYLIDEPSGLLSVEKTIVVSKVIKKFIRRTKKTAFVVDHNLMLATYLADKVIVFEGNPSVGCAADSPQSLSTGMNRFLSHLDISCRRDPTNYQPIFNKPNSAWDREQKSAGHYYLDD